jgi:probable O-glycosylation ligase (exosortase A-associated)
MKESMSATEQSKNQGVLFERPALGAAQPTIGPANERSVEQASKRRGIRVSGSQPVAFAGLFLFTLLLYVRPNDFFPGFFSIFPIVKIVAIGTILAYVVGRISRGERLTVWPIELKMLLAIVLLGIVFLPIAASKSDTIDMLTDTFLKVVIIFVLMINIIDTKERLYSMLSLVVICGTIISLATIQAYVTGGGQVDAGKNRLFGIVDGIFGNPNDLAMAIDLLLPLAIVLALSKRGLARWLYWGCALIFVLAVILSFSRGGFLGLVAMGMVLLWKVGRSNRLVAVMLVMMTLAIFASAVPNGYTDRIFTIFNSQTDETGSSQQRKALLERAVALAKNHIVFGVGMGNYGIYSLNNMRAHNSYLEIWVELGMAGLVAYLVLIFAPLRSLKRVERETVGLSRAGDREIYNLSVGVQAAIVAYVVCSLFGSVQYNWFIYYPVAYAIAIKHIHSRRRDDGAVAIEHKQAAVVAAPATRGTLWGEKK